MAPADSMLNAALDIDELSARFRDRQRMEIRDALEPDVARDLYRCLDREVKWRIAFIGDRGSTTMEADGFRRMSDRQREEFHRVLLSRARGGFQFLYQSYMMVTAYKEGCDPQLVLHPFLEYLNSEPFLDFMRRLTGVTRIRKADAQATCYTPGNFLKQHNDITPEQGREVAYVLNLTREWHADWGGLLQFMDEDGAVIDTFMPRFNSLTLFRVPMHHCVSCVAPFAERPRYAITGWLRSD